jgi:ABC-type transport system involved in multi-copper enzyme maturation permease subunit
MNDPGLRGYPPNSDRELSIQQMSELGQQLFVTFAITQSLVLLLITPALVAGVIADEKQRKTLHYLLSSCLSSGEIVLGKLAARLVHVGVFIALGLPIVSILTFIGGVDPNAVLLFFTASLSTVFFLAGLAVAVSVYSKRPREAVSLVYMLELVWLFVPALIQLLLPMGGGVYAKIYEWIRPVNEWVTASSPFHLLTTGAATAFASPLRFYETVFWMIGLQVAYGTVFTVFAIARLRPVLRSEGSGGGKVARVFSRRARRLLPRPECGDDAMLWKERYVSRTSPITKITGSVVFLGVLVLLGWGTYEVAAPAFREVMASGYAGAGSGSARGELNTYLRFVVTLVFACWVIGTASAASGSVSSEREEDTWTSLVATPLSGLEVIRAKMFGSCGAMRWIAVVWLLLVVLGLLLGAIHPLGFAALVLVSVIDVWFACALGTYFSLRARNSSRALMATIGTLILCNGLYLLLFIPFRVESSFRFLGMMPFVEVLALLSYSDVEWLVTGKGWGGPHQNALDLFTTGLASVVVYAVAAAGFSYSLVADFDRIIDRPRGSVRDPLLDDARMAQDTAADEPDPEADSEVSAGLGAGEEG